MALPVAMKNSIWTTLFTFTCGMIVVAFLLALSETAEVAYAGNFPQEVVQAINGRLNRTDTIKVNLISESSHGSLYISPYGMLSEWPNAKKQVVTRSVKNRDYAFQVKLKDGAYHLSGVRRPAEEPKNFEKLMQADMELAFPETNSFGIPILEFNKPENFEKLSEKQIDSKLHVALRCKLDGHEFLKKDGVYTLVFDPKLDYCLCRAELECTQNKTHILVDYKTQEGFGHVPSRLQIRSEYPGHPPSCQDYKIAAPERATLDAAEFRLPFYGISESAVGIGTRWDRWMILGACAASASALVALWRSLLRR